jgi:DNA helicase-2/ATP-dependent DNA helicase PcrA
MIDTPQQVAIFDEVRAGGDDLAVVARAGCGKTTTMVKAVGSRRGGTAVMCAFAKRNALDLAEKLKGEPFGFGVRAKTLHQIGMATVAAALGDLEVDRQRELKIATELLGEDAPDIEREEVGKLAALAKEIAPDEITSDRLTSIAIDFGYASGDEDVDDGLSTVDRARIRAKHAIEVIERSLEVRGVISYADMIWLPLARKLTPRRANMVIVDEAQDMNLAQLRLAARVRAAGGRMIVVGDPRQAIYSWRGAAPGALEHVAEALQAKRMPLTRSFRCALKIIELAQTIVPDIEAAPGAPDGSVSDVAVADFLRSAAPGDFLLSRTNAPLASYCMQLIRAGKRAQIIGSDIGPTLIDLCRKLGRRADTGVSGLLTKLARWREREITKAKQAKASTREAFVADVADALVAISEGAADVADVIARIDRIFADDGEPKISLSTVHRAKGLEADRVWVLTQTLDDARPRTPIEQVEESNLRYVAITRARRELMWIQT